MKEQWSLHGVEIQLKVQETLKIENPERGVTTLEYAIIALIVVTVVLGSMRALGVSIADVFQQAASALGG